MGILSHEPDRLAGPPLCNLYALSLASVVRMSKSDRLDEVDDRKAALAESEKIARCHHPQSV